MKLLGVLALVMAYVLGNTTFALTDRTRISVKAEDTLYAGETWTLTVFVIDAEAGETVQALLINGLQMLRANLTLGDGGVALWRIPAGQLVQAGQSLLILRYDEHETRYPLRVLPTDSVSADLFATLNQLMAYGEGETIIIALPRDEWGNATAGDQQFWLNSYYPGGHRDTQEFTYAGGLGWLTLQSRGGPGRLRLTLEPGRVVTNLELHQSPGRPHDITLLLAPGCVLNDGRDTVLVAAIVLDAHGNTVADGTLVTFTWRNGQGVGRTLDGRASLRLPAPTRTGWVMYRAAAGEVISMPEFLQVTQGFCPND